MNFLKEGKTNWKYILIIATLAIIVGGGILWFSMRQEVPIKFPEIKKPEKIVKDETANWKTYRNEEYGFEFKYPSIPQGCENCKIQESEEGFSVNRTFLSINDLKGLTISEFIDKRMEEVEIERKEKILFGGKERVTVDYRFGGMGRFGSAAFIEKNGKVIIFGFTAGGFCCDPKVDRIYEIDIYQAMLSTFRFIEEVKTTDWETYRNEKFGFEVKYPPKFSFFYENKEKSAASWREHPEAEGGLDIFVENRGEKTAEEWIEERNQAAETQRYKKLEDITLNSSKGVIVEDGHTIGNWSIVAIFSHGDYLFEFGFMTSIQELKQVLSTFRFLE